MFEMAQRPPRRTGAKALAALGTAAVMTVGFAMPAAVADTVRIINRHRPEWRTGERRARREPRR